LTAEFNLKWAINRIWSHVSSIVITKEIFFCPKTTFFDPKIPCFLSKHGKINVFEPKNCLLNLGSNSIEFDLICWIRPNIVKIDSVTLSFCLHHYVQNGLSYSAEETRPTLCKPMPIFQLGIRSKRTNKHQLLHRIASVKTPLIYNTNSTFEFGIQNLKNRKNAKEFVRAYWNLCLKCKQLFQFLQSFSQIWAS